LVNRPCHGTALPWLALILTSPASLAGTIPVGEFTEELYPAGFDEPDLRVTGIARFEDGATIVHRSGVGVSASWQLVSTVGDLSTWTPWSEPVNPSDGAGSAALVTLADGEVGVLWTDLSLPVRSDVWFRRMHEEDPGSPTLLRENEVLVTPLVGTIVNRLNHVWASWVTFTDHWEVLAARSTDGGVTFDEPTTQPFPIDTSDGLPSAVWLDDELHVLAFEYESHDERYLRHFVGDGQETWEELASPVPEGMIVTGPVALARNEEGTLGVLLAAGPELDDAWPMAMYFIESTDRGRTWSAPEKLAGSPTGARERSSRRATGGSRWS